MIELEKISKRIDEALAKETPESMKLFLDRLHIKSLMTDYQRGRPAEKHLPKEFSKVAMATQFIGEGIGSTGKYMLAWGERANTGNYTEDDVIMLAANGRRKGAFVPVIDGVLQGEYKNIDLAIKADASFVADTREHLIKTRHYNVGEALLAEYLYRNGYSYETYNNVGLWKRN